MSSLKNQNKATRISFTLSHEQEERLNRYAKEWALGKLKNNVSAIIQDLIDRYIPHTP